MKVTRRSVLDALRHPLGASTVFIVCFALFLEFLLPYLGGWLAAQDWFSIRSGLRSSGKEVPLYMTLAVLACFCFLTYSEERWQRFQAPVWEFMRWKHPMRAAVLCVVPVFVAVVVFLGEAGGGAEPVANPIRHPTPPDQFSKLKNPFRRPNAEMLSAFDEALRSGQIDIEASTEPQVVAYGRALQSGKASEEDRPAAFRRHVIEEGRTLFMINCRPCHGTKAMGDGPMSVGQRREPADFTGVETIATLVEGAVFWRVNRGGIKLPHEGAPWESAMPRWETDLSQEEIWKIIMAEYDIAGNAPRESEGHAQATPTGQESE